MVKHMLAMSKQCDTNNVMKLNKAIDKVPLDQHTNVTARLLSKQCGERMKCMGVERFMSYTTKGHISNMWRDKVVW